MYYCDRYKYGLIRLLFLLAAILMMSIGCNSLLPEKFQNKTFEASKTDEQACTPLATADSSIDKESVAYKIQSKTLQSILPDTSWQDSSDNKIIYAKFNEVVDSLPVLVTDQLLKIEYPSGQNVSYAVLKIAAGDKGDLVLYTSLNYYYDNTSHTSNINEYITVELVKSDTSVVVSSNDMQEETLSECTDEVLVASNLRVVPIIRSRDKVHVQEGTYLIRFTLSDAQNIAAFKPGQRIRNYYFKMIIL